MTCALTGPRRSRSVQVFDFGLSNSLPESFHFGPEFFETAVRAPQNISLSAECEVRRPHVLFRLLV